MARIFLAVIVIVVFGGGTVSLLMLSGNKSSTQDVDMEAVNQALEEAQAQTESQDQLQEQLQSQNDTQNMSEYLTKETIQAGTGKEVKKGSNVLMHYKGMLEDGTVFDSSYGRAPFETTIGVGRLIKGWDEGVPGMKEGEKAKLTIKPEWGYGAGGIPGTIPENATLIFEVEVVEVLS